MPKLKTRKTAAKRLGKNKKVREVKGISHLRSKETSSVKKRTGKKRALSEKDRKVFKKMVPGLR